MLVQNYELRVILFVPPLLMDQINKRMKLLV